MVLPQAIPPVVPALGNHLVAMFKDTPLLSAITVVELLQQSKMLGSATFRYTEPLTLVGALFLALSLLAAWGVRGWKPACNAMEENDERQCEHSRPAQALRRSGGAQGIDLEIPSGQTVAVIGRPARASRPCCAY